MIDLNRFDQVYVHQSQFPEKVYQDYLESFQTKKINHKFHYDSVKQSQKWLKLHQAYSPAKNSDAVALTYSQCFQKVSTIAANDLSIEVIGLGCGGGDKDRELLSFLENKSKALTYYPLDVSLSLALISAHKAKRLLPEIAVWPVVCDLLSADDLISNFSANQGESHKIITFFGMIPNFLPTEILPILSNFLTTGDTLLMSANLAPGNDYLGGIEQVLPQYDNELTRDWLMTILLDAGINPADGEIKFEIQGDSTISGLDLKRINASFQVRKSIHWTLDGRSVEWQEGDQVQLFFSYRYTSNRLQAVLQQYRLNILDYWEDDNQEEGVYLIAKI